jgi:hypothetical protein
MTVPQFYETGMGQKFYNAHVPRLLELLSKLVESSEKTYSPDGCLSELCPKLPQEDIPKEVREYYTKAAKKKHASEGGDIEVDADPMISLSHDDNGKVQGAYVMSWTYVLPPPEERECLL